MKPKSKTSNIALLVEDFKMDAEQTTLLLVEAGYQEKNIFICDTREAAEQFLKKYTPEIAILDLQIPNAKGGLKSLANGLALLRFLVENYGDKIRIIAFSRYPELPVVYQVLSLGVSFVTKEDYNKEFFSLALNQIRNGHMVISTNVLPVLRKVFVAALRVGLDEDDKKILQLILQGKTDRDIAEELKYGDDWVANRLRRMFKSFGFRSREDLSAWYRDYVVPLYGSELDGLKK